MYEKIINAVESVRDFFLNKIDVKSSTVELLEDGKIVIFPVMKKQSLPETSTKTSRKKINQVK